MKKNKTRKPLSLKFKLLIVLIPLIFMYTWLITAINSGYIMSSTQSSLKKTLGETAKITSEHITQSISSNKNLTRLLANRVATEYGEEIKAPYNADTVADFALKISNLGKEYGFLHMMVAGNDGFTKTTVHTDLVKNKADYYIAINDDKKESYVSDVTMDKGSFKGKYVLNYSAPIKDSAGNMIGVLICKSDAVELSELVKSVSVGKNGSTFIMDNHGQCIAHKNSDMLFLGESYLKYKKTTAEPNRYPTLNKLWDSMMEKSSGYMTYDLDGKRIASFAHIEGTNNWSIAITASEYEFMQGAIDARNTVSKLGIGMIILLGVLLIFLLRYLTGSIIITAKRLESLSEGDLNSEIQTDNSSAETYLLSVSASKLINTIQTMIHETEHTLSEIANGNLTVKPEIDYPGDFHVLKEAIETNLKKLNNMIHSISRASEEVARGSSQMSSGASGLAQGASEQASSLEELFETVSALAQRTYEIGGMDKRKVMDIDDDGTNTDETDSVIKKYEAADTLAEKLTIAIQRIAETSASIQKIAADIEAISSETGMLALNASVEATHAGEAGRGFSVIASEIRSLSDKSRDAAKEADSKIESISRAVTRGTQTVDLTVSTIGEMTLAMDQVKSALEQISNIVENIAATAEETAAGSEELNSQADVLKNLVAEFKYQIDDEPSTKQNGGYHE